MLILDSRSALIRNSIVAAANGAIALVLLLIAPLGLATVITLTVLIVVSTWGCLFVADWVVRFLFRGRRSSGSTYSSIDPRSERQTYEAFPVERERQRLR